MRSLITALGALLCAMGLAGAWWPARAAGPSPSLPPALSSTTLAKPLPQPFEAAADARADIKAAFARAAQSGKRVVLDVGANWCPDCRALAGMMALPEFRTLMAQRYEVVHLDVGRFDRNRDVLGELGLAMPKGIPAIFIYAPDRKLLNANETLAWESAASANANDAYAYFLRWSR